MEKCWSSGWEPNQSYTSMGRKVTGTGKMRRKATRESSNCNVKSKILERSNWHTQWWRLWTYTLEADHPDLDPSLPSYCFDFSCKKLGQHSSLPIFKVVRTIARTIVSKCWLSYQKIPINTPWPVRGRVCGNLSQEFFLHSDLFNILISNLCKDFSYHICEYLGSR